MAVSTFILRCMRHSALAATLIMLPTMAMGQEVRATDSLGREVVLQQPATRVGAPQTTAVGIVLSITRDPAYLAGISDYTRNFYADTMIGRIFPGVLDVPVGLALDTSGLNINVEALAALDPQLVFQRDAPQDAYQPLLNIGVPTALYATGAEANTQNFIAMAATLMGMDQRGADIVAARRAVADDIRAIGQTIPEEERVRVLYIISVDGGSVQIVANSSTVGEAMRLVGVSGLTIPGGETSATTTPTVSVEEIAGWNPDVILVGLARSLDAVLDNPVIAATNAALNDKIYVVPSGTGPWSSTSPETPLLWIMLAELLYPNHFDYDFRQEMRDWFSYLYAYDISDDEIDTVIYADLNAGTAGFTRFLAR